MDRRELGLTIADHGGWEEFHQKRGNFSMYDYHKSIRLRLEEEYRTRFGNKGETYGREHLETYC